MHVKRHGLTATATATATVRASTRPQPCAGIRTMGLAALHASSRSDLEKALLHGTANPQES